MKSLRKADLRNADIAQSEVPNKSASTVFWTVGGAKAKKDMFLATRV